MRNALWIYVLICSSSSALAQNVVRKSFEFLQVPSAARLSALGNINVSLSDRDVNFVQFNPALNSDSLGGVAAVNYQFYVAGIGNSSVKYVHNFDRVGAVSFGVQHLSYGTIKSYDASGNEIGDFKAGESAITISKSHQLGNFRLGVTTTFAFSNLAGFRASAALVNVGGLFIHPNRRLTIGMSVTNLGFMMSDYSGTSDTRLPLNVQLGTTFKPEHLPVRFSITAWRLTDPEAYYDSASNASRPSTFDQVLRHLNFAAEVLLHRNVDLLVGYNHGMHQELKLNNGGGGAGITFGFSVHIRSFEFTFSRSAFVAGQAGYALSLSQNMNKLLRRR
ncbi:type IX secretion system protein PorQ [Chryseolinea sp. T2]|uniref:type IX secretion system protein PorQ n=1 Tax=Chryseolinea sp. T2 TaxID=3129255 RepID=UPI003076EB4A